MSRARELAEQFHEAYERLAPSFGYETRRETKDFIPTSANGRLMLAVCEEVMQKAILQAVAEERERAATHIDNAAAMLTQPIGAADLRMLASAIRSGGAAKKGE